MLDIAFIRENKKQVAKSAQDRGVEVDIDRLLELDEQRRHEISALEKLRAERNELATKNKGQKPDDAAIKAGQKLKNDITSLEKRLAPIEKEFSSLNRLIPNVMSEDTPIGPDESGNKVLRQWGDKPQFKFEPKEHFEILESRGLIDKQRAAKTSGARFYFALDGMVELELALTQFVLQLLSDESQLKKIIDQAGLKVSSKPFRPVIPPEIIHTSVLEKMGRHDPPEDKYHLKEEDQVLIGSAEHSLGSMHMDEVLSSEDLPIRYIGISSAFRREAGTYGKDTKGILRVHQFRKLEMESFTKPEDSLAEQDFFIAIQEHIMQALNIPYQVMAICSGDMGKPDFRQVDIEAWMPGQNKYRETHTADLMTDFQSRRLNIKYKNDQGKSVLVHMNDATAAAIGRMQIAIVENYQNEDGTITVPEVLRPFIGGKEIL